MKVTFSDGELKDIDANRGQVPRATYVRRTVLGAIGRKPSPAAEMVQDGRDLGVDLKLGTEIEPRSPKLPKESTYAFPAKRAAFPKKSK